MNEVVIVSATRTPIGKIRGALSPVRADDLAALVIRSALDRAGLDGGEVEEVPSTTHPLGQCCITVAAAWGRYAE